MIARVPPSPALRGAPPRLRQAAIALIVVATVTGLLGAAFMPYLLVEHPLLLIGLSPGPANLVLAAGSLDPWS
ncbi:MAG: hypothetical protein KC731_28890, partial [Myxococcales bacterium]|nr:hypothetical protein [Myxococcales bacterium]